MNGIKVCLGWDIINTACDLDASAFMLGADGRVIGDDWFVFYGQTVSPDGSVKHSGDSTNGVGAGDDETIDAFFQICEELRVKVPETMKYFCTTEAVANYLQKHIVYRKRTVFFGNGTPESVIGLIGPKHKGETFLIATSDSSSKDAVTRQFETTKFNFATAVFVKSVPQDLKEVDMHAYDAIVMFNPADVKSLYDNQPDFTQGNIKFVSYGKSVVKAMEEAGLEIAISAPTVEAPSVAKALEIFLTNN